MRKIKKNDSPVWFEKWKTEFYSSFHRQPEYEDFDAASRRRLRNELVKEQGFICCYCMRRIYQEGSHIEHFKPRERYKSEEMNYDNMYASCDGNEQEMQIFLQHCDTRKWDWFDDRMPSPLDPDIEKCVEYRVDGKVSPYHHRDNIKYEIEKRMLEHLGLNAPYLVRNRRKTYEESELMDDADYDTEDWMEFIRYYDSMHNGMYEEYCGALISLMREFID